MTTSVQLAGQQLYLDSLPKELIGLICQYLNIIDLYRWSLTSKRYYNLCWCQENRRHLIPKTSSRDVKVPFITKDGSLWQVTIKICTFCAKIFPDALCHVRCRLCSKRKCSTRMNDVIFSCIDCDDPE